MRNSLVLILIGWLCLAGCRTEPGQSSPTPDDDPPVPVIDYPDVYINLFKFGFNLPEGWAADLRDTENILILSKDGYALHIGYGEANQPLPALREPIPYDLVEDAGSLTLHSFWNGEIAVPKYRLKTNDRVTTIYYGDEIVIGSLELTVVLSEESPAGGTPQGISPAIEAEADTIIQSYEEHGWEE